jgi:hypothetical protein
MGAELSLPDLRSLVDAVCADTASAEDLRALSAVLYESDAAQEYYLEYCRMHIELYFCCGEQRLNQSLMENIGSDTPVVNPTNLPATTALFHGAIAYFSADWPLAYLLATVITALGLLIAGLVHVSAPEEVAQRSVAPVRGATTDFVGKITGVAETNWTEGAGVRLGQKVDLPTGLLEITYNTGAKVILQGPVDYQVESNGGYLAVGKLTGKLEHRNDEAPMTNDERKHEIRMTKREGMQNSSFDIRPSSFAIRTPTATVTDLGTEFGVEVERDGATETEVFVGLVKLVRSGAGSNGTSDEHVIRAGNTSRVDAKGAHPVAAIHPGACRFVRALPSRIKTAADAYAETVLSMRPVAYYRMEPPRNPKDQDILMDSSLGTRNGRLYFNEQYFGERNAAGRFGQSLRLRGTMAGDYAIVPDGPHVIQDRLTVSAWVYLLIEPTGSRGIIATHRGIYASSDDAAPVQFTLDVCVSGCLEAMVTPHHGQKMAVTQDGAKFPRGVWQHVALVADGTTLHLYRNGLVVGSAPCAGVLPKPKTSSLAVGCVVSNDGITPLARSPYFWSGRIDELAIFDRALSPDDIQRLSGAPSARSQLQLDSRNVTTE